MPKPPRPRLPGDPPRRKKSRFEPPSSDSVLKVVAALIYLLASMF